MKMANANSVQLVRQLPRTALDVKYLHVSRFKLYLRVVIVLTVRSTKLQLGRQTSAWTQNAKKDKRCLKMVHVKPVQLIKE